MVEEAGFTNSNLSLEGGRGRGENEGEREKKVRRRRKEGREGGRERLFCHRLTCK